MKKLNEISDNELQELLEEISLLEKEHILIGINPNSQRSSRKLRHKQKQFERLISYRQRIYMKTICKTLNIESDFF